jgi:hypothetical protein
MPFARQTWGKSAPLSERVGGLLQLGLTETLSAWQPRSVDPGLAGPHLREAAQFEGTRMFSVINPDLLWLALGFILSMAGMLATYPE